MKRSLLFIVLLSVFSLTFCLAAENTQKLGINTDGWEDGVTISADGKELYFTYTPYDPVFLDAGYDKKGPQRPGNHGFNHDIYRSVRQQDGSWSEPEAVVELNSMKPEYSPSLSSDGKVMYFVRDVSMGKTEIYFSLRSDKGWSRPNPLPKPFNSDFSEDSPLQAPDNSFFIFASRRIKFSRPWDLWISNKGPDGKLGELELVGFNSKYNDWQPAVDPATGDIYFVSDRNEEHSSDIYVAPKNSNGVWEKPRPIKRDWSSTMISSPCFDSTGKYLYFSQYVKGETGFMDIYVSSRAADNSWGKPVPIEDFRP